MVGKVETLAEAVDQRPEDTAVAVAQLKRYLPDPVHRIRLHDLIMGEINAAIEQFQDLPTDIEITSQFCAERMGVYEQAMTRVMQLLANGAFFSDRERHDRIWVRCIERLATRTQTQTGHNVLVDMQQYPTLLALYILALGACAAGRIDPIARVLAEINVPKNYHSSPISVSVASRHVLDDNMMRRSIDELKNHKTPVSDHLWNTVGTVASTIVSNPARCEDLFDEVEYLMGIAYVVNRDGRSMSISWSPYRASWRSDFFSSSGYRLGALVKRNAKVLISTGLFESEEQLQQIYECYDKWLSQVGM